VAHRPFAVYRLPRGRHGLPAATVAENQRWRLLGAATEVLAECGYGKISTHAIAARAGVSRSTYYEHFENCDACLLAAFTVTAESLDGAVRVACAPRSDERGRVIAAVAAVLAIFGSEPSLLSLFDAGLQAGVPAVGAVRAELIRNLATALAGAGPAPPPSSAEYLIGGALAIVSSGLLVGDARPPTAIAAELTGLLIEG
jgi:AcrR family transcriptional regulator